MPRVVTVIDVPSVTLFDGELVIKGNHHRNHSCHVVIMVALTCFVKKTKPGRAMQAVSEDRDAAQLMGVNVNATISLTFAIGSGLAAIAGLLLCQTYPTLTPYTGAMPGIKAFVAAVFGGIGSIREPWWAVSFWESLRSSEKPTFLPRLRMRSCLQS